jgi:integrase
VPGRRPVPQTVRLPPGLRSSLALADKPHDFPHAGVSWRLAAGTPAPLVAEWAGHAVEVLLRSRLARNTPISMTTERSASPEDTVLARASYRVS